MTPKGAEARDALLSRLSSARWPYGPLLDALDLPAELDVLDIGAGAGHGLGVLAWREQTGRVVGLDPTPGPGVQLGQAEHLPFAAQSFDVALLVRVLAHVTDPARALAEAWRVLRPGGRLVLAAQGGEHLAQTWRALGRPVSGESGPDAALRDSLRQAGHVATRLDVRLPLTIHAADAEALVSSYGLRLSVNPARFAVTDHLHLCVYVARKP
ncbi:methyltransferase domain-containing protein [Deinococcus sp. VB142]|uniref:Methyltransferase domain-containing protein n=1 Tax=Deinococcus sp. VB142 TaxID=3112952 RepID=A0AAU6Q4Z8_9DEIO